MGLTSERLMDDAQCSRATLYRDLELLRDTLGAPLESDGRKPNTWRYAPNEQAVFQLPGVWLSADELYALLLAQQVLKRSGAESLLGEAMGHLKPRISKLLGPGKTRRLDRLRVLRAQARGFDNSVFRIVAEAVLEGRQLRFAYSARSTAMVTERTVSPQRLTHHRDNWYLDAWDPAAGSLRSFALDRIQRPSLDPQPAIEMTDAQLEAQQEAGYGIFSGPVQGTATIRFSAHAARWVADERWHPQQQHHHLPDGRLDLTLPYCNPRELLMDVQRYGADAEVIAPSELREQMRGMLVGALGLYGDGG